MIILNNMSLSQDKIDFIEMHFHENLTEFDYEIFSQLKSADELHFLAQHYNWDSGVEVLKWIAESKQCSEATALEIFWLAQPQEFQHAKLDKSLKDQYKNDVFDLIKTILKNYPIGFYQKSDLNFNPKPYYETQHIIPEHLKETTIGEESYIYYEQDDVDNWFNSDWQRNIERADSVIELFNIAYFIDEPEYSDWILEHPLCDKGIASLVYWRLYNECAIYTDTPKKLAKIEQNLKSNLYPEILAYDPKTDEKVKVNTQKVAWEIPAIFYNDV